MSSIFKSIFKSLFIIILLPSVSICSDYCIHGDCSDLKEIEYLYLSNINYYDVHNVYDSEFETRLNKFLQENINKYFGKLKYNLPDNLVSLTGKEDQRSSKYMHIEFDIISTNKNESIVAYFVKCKLGNPANVAKRGYEPDTIWTNEVIGYVSSKKFEISLKEIISDNIAQMSLDFFKVKDKD